MEFFENLIISLVLAMIVIYVVDFIHAMYDLWHLTVIP